MSEPHPAVIEEARKAAYQSPCFKSKRGVVVFDPMLVKRALEIHGLSPATTRSAWLIVNGHNTPPDPFICDGSESCRQDCSKTCVHAEQRALSNLQEVSIRSTYPGFDMLHVKVVDGRVVTSGPPACWQCSRAILEAGIGGVWLYLSRLDLYRITAEQAASEGIVDEPVWRRWSALDFHAETLANCGMPEAARRRQ